MLMIALRAPAGPLPVSFEHTVHYRAAHANQPCLDSAGLDWTVPQAGFSLVLLPDRTHQALLLNSTTYSPGPQEFRLYNRPPPLS